MSSVTDVRKPRASCKAWLALYRGAAGWGATVGRIEVRRSVSSVYSGRLDGFSLKLVDLHGSNHAPVHDENAKQQHQHRQSFTARATPKIKDTIRMLARDMVKAVHDAVRP